MASIKKCKKIIEAGREAGVAVWIWGAHGNGKSQIVKQVAEKMDVGFNDIRISLTEAGDWMGLPFINPATKRMEFAPSPYLPYDIESKGILFLDELNRGRPDVTQCVFQITLDHKIGTHYELPVDDANRSSLGFLFDLPRIKSASVSFKYFLSFLAAKLASLLFVLEISFFLSSNRRILWTYQIDIFSLYPFCYVTIPHIQFLSS